MKTYTFKVVVEPDDGRCHAPLSGARPYGAATWGDTEEEAFRNIREVMQMVVKELREDGIAIPEGPQGDVDVYQGTRIAVTV